VRPAALVDIDRAAARAWERSQPAETARLGLTLLLVGPALFAWGWWLLAEAAWEAVRGVMEE